MGATVTLAPNVSIPLGEETTDHLTRGQVESVKKWAEMLMTDCDHVIEVLDERARLREEERAAREKGNFSQGVVTSALNNSALGRSVEGLITRYGYVRQYVHAVAHLTHTHYKLPDRETEPES